MASNKITPGILMTVAQFIGSRVDMYGVFNCENLSSVNTSDVTWEEYVNHVYDYMASRFIIEKDDGESFNIGIRWLKKQYWKV